MERTPVKSSDLASVGYDASSRILEIEFSSGSLYEYSGVPSGVYQGLVAAESKGVYFNEIVKKGGYPYTRIS